ncbi:DUF58 domain-containing protein [Stieleria varia]|uniref:Uncharacterized protein n=1 Tax=Stieleria varia TaxID=2528005 RepID=A0A5C6A5P9_9BACT|nr:DUF58 domain-containing protein [Stieleria varia]TWT94725.1 hypothetical protein Pla52n_55500 [Stieleria varia]
MAIVHDASTGTNLAARLLTTDFCPWANRFVYWLKEPIGWFFLATIINVVVGLYLAPIGWTLAASLTAVMAVGVAWPAIAVRAVSCSLSSDKPQVHEGDPCELRLTTSNRLPIPVWGLAIEGFLDRKSEADGANVPTVALAFVKGFSTATFRFTVRPELRGRYPDGDAVITCSFPFGIWTARRKLKDVSRVTVWPKVFPIAGQTAMVGRRAAEAGEGNRVGRAGEFLGVREYRQGDCMRQVNWVATAKTGDLVVTQRSGPQCPDVDVLVDVGWTSHQDQLSDRIRVAASVLANLHQSTVPLRVHIGKRCLHVRRGWDGLTQMLDALAEIPANGIADSELSHPSRLRAAITISSNHRGDITACISDPSENLRSDSLHTHRVLRRDQDLASQLLSFWTEVRDANLVA